MQSASLRGGSPSRGAPRVRPMHRARAAGTRPAQGLPNREGTTTGPGPRRARPRGRPRHRVRPTRPQRRGKSTTVRFLGTLSRPDEGTAMVAGVDVTADPTGVRRRIGLVPQQPSSDPMATGRENLMLVARIQGLPKSTARERADWLLRRFSIADAADRLVRTWSGGMSRKLDVAIGLVHRPAVLFLDEPTDRPGPGGACGAVGRDRPARRGRRDDGAADHPLPRRGRSTGSAARDHRPRPGGGRRHPPGS